MLMILANYCDTEGRCYPSLGRLASDSQLPVEIVQKKLNSLVGSGHISLRERKPPMGPIYFLGVGKTPSPPPPPAKKKTKRLKVTPEALALYEAYPRKSARDAALRSIMGALKKEPYSYLLERVQAYRTAVKTWPIGDEQFIPHPATWFNNACWADDPATWERAEVKLLQKKTQVDKALEAAEKFIADGN